MRETMKKGEITAFLSLVFLLMISFTGAMIESASIQVLKNYKRADMSLAIESLFAEYQSELLEEYDVFAMDGRAAGNMMNRLFYYGAAGIKNEVERSELLTDFSGRAFYEQAVRYMENKLGLDVVKKEEERLKLWKEQDRDSKEYQEEETSISGGLEDMLEESGENLPEEDNPLRAVTNLKSSGLLQVVVPNPEQLSNKAIQRENLASFRELNKGTGKMENSEVMNGKVLFQAYLQEHFKNMMDAEEGKVLSYEVEYLLGGHMSDRENLEYVVKKILSLRFVVNYGYLLTDEVKKGEAEVLALTLCSLLTVPGVTEVVKHAVLLAWAYGESIMDIRSLLEGKKVPFVKSTENWQLQLSKILTLGDDEAWQNGTDSENGMTYQDYLKGLLMLEQKECLSMRALDLIESNLQIKADECITYLEMKSDCVLRRGIHYEFLTSFGYQ